MCGAIAKSQPENCVVVDESLTSGSMYWDATDAFSLGLRIWTAAYRRSGLVFGLSAAVGAAVADRSRKNNAFQTDGSGLCDCQALDNVQIQFECVVICNNSAYNILNIENAMQRVEDANKTNLSKSLTSLGDPAIDWVAMAKSFGFRMATR